MLGPERLTVDELAAIARLSATNPHPSVTTSEVSVESGLRSLIARGFFRGFDDTGSLLVAAEIRDLAVGLAESDRFAVLVRASESATVSGRIVVLADGVTVVEESAYPGVLATTPVPRDGVVELARDVLGLAADVAAPTVDGGGGSVRATLHRPEDGQEPISAPGWTVPVLCSVLVAAGPNRGASVQWAASDAHGGRHLWLLDPESLDEDGGVDARPSSAAEIEGLVGAAFAVMLETEDPSMSGVSR